MLSAKLAAGPPRQPSIRLLNAMPAGNPAMTATCDLPKAGRAHCQR
jgi:hypothetical protein